MSRLINLVGDRFGQLLVIKRSHGKQNARVCWSCRCDCGNIVTVLAYNLKSSHTKSCGCLAKRILVKRSTTHGHSATDKESSTYRSWRGMVQRCNNPNNKGYHNYGGRGVIVCKRWLSFENFLEDMGEAPKGHQIDRINNNRGYYKSNCQWATRKEQARNKRNNHLITHKGKTQCIATWAEEFGISRDTISRRLSRGWSTEKALTTSVGHKGNL